MPRLPPSLFWKSRHLSPQGPILLPACRDLDTVRSELRWIIEHVRQQRSPIPVYWRYWKLCERRGRGLPLQYVLGTQPFGDLEIRCRPGVLIPRHETEAYTVYLAHKLIQQERSLSSDGGPRSLRILDVCTGTGCIALQLFAQLRRALPTHSIKVIGLEVSPVAVLLARQNLASNTRSKQLISPSTEASVEFIEGDLFSPNTTNRLASIAGGNWDVVVSNPPYISERGFALETARAVRNWEPRTALVPLQNVGQEYIATGCAPEDVFYARLVDMADALKPRVMLFEVAGMEQAERVALLVKSAVARAGKQSALIEIWRDTPGREVEASQAIEGVNVRGDGHGRSVYVQLN